MHFHEKDCISRLIITIDFLLLRKWRMMQLILKQKNAYICKWLALHYHLLCWLRQEKSVLVFQGRKKQLTVHLMSSLNLSFALNNAQLKLFPLTKNFLESIMESKVILHPDDDFYFIRHFFNLDSSFKWNSFRLMWNWFRSFISW